MSEHLRTAKIPCKEGVQKYRVHKCLFRKKRVSEHFWCPNTVISRMRLLKKERCSIFFYFFGGGGGGGGAIFPRSRFIKAIISIHMYIVRSSICHPSKYQTSKFFFLDFQN